MLNPVLVCVLVSGGPVLDGELSVPAGEEPDCQAACVQPGAAPEAGLVPQHLSGLQGEETSSAAPQLPQLDQRHTAGCAAIWSSPPPGRKKGNGLVLSSKPKTFTATLPLRWFSVFSLCVNYEPVCPVLHIPGNVDS